MSGKRLSFVKIVSDGTHRGTMVTNPNTGEAIPGVVEVVWRSPVTNNGFAMAEMKVMAQLDVVAEVIPGEPGEGAQS